MKVCQFCSHCSNFSLHTIFCILSFVSHSAVFHRIGILSFNFFHNEVQLFFLSCLSTRSRVLIRKLQCSFQTAPLVLIYYVWRIKSATNGPCRHIPVVLWVSISILVDIVFFSFMCSTNQQSINSLIRPIKYLSMNPYFTAKRAYFWKWPPVLLLRGPLAHPCNFLLWTL
jgi:hypothetical protein